MAMADTAPYVAIHASIGITPLAVTLSLYINFLRRQSADTDILTICKLLKVGRSLSVGEVTLFSEGPEDPVAPVVGTYAIPQGHPAHSPLTFHGRTGEA